MISPAEPTDDYAEDEDDEIWNVVLQIVYYIIYYMVNLSQVYKNRACSESQSHMPRNTL